MLPDALWNKYKKDHCPMGSEHTDLRSVKRRGYLFNVQSFNLYECERLYDRREAPEEKQKMSKEVARDQGKKLQEIIHRQVRTCIKLFFVDENGANFQSHLLFRPYFLIELREKIGPLEIEGSAPEESLRETVDQLATENCRDGPHRIETIHKIDLSSMQYLKRDLSEGEPYRRRRFLKVSFATERDTSLNLQILMKEITKADQRVQLVISRWKERLEAGEGWSLENQTVDHFASLSGVGSLQGVDRQALAPFEDILHHEKFALVEAIRERDLPIISRFLIDSQLRCGSWYDVHWFGGIEPPTELAASVGDSSWYIPDDLTDHQASCVIERIPPLPALPPLRVFAWDIEVTKAPLRFPTPETDEIMMISYLTGDGGGLIVNRAVVSENIDHFNYSPSPEFAGVFECYNVANEYELLMTFFKHIQLLDPHIHVTYNGDSFDMDYVWRRALKYGVDMRLESGFPNPLVSQLPDLTQEDAFMRGAQKEFRGDSALHIDCLRWVERDSYLPMGSRGLKAVTKAKLRFDPRELAVELMTPYATSHPQLLAEYSVSDAVCTYYLYMKYIHNFVLALSSIIPMAPDDVLRRGSGTLCEHLLMARAHGSDVIFPDKVNLPMETYWNNFLLHSETYVGGKVDQLASGCFRSDVPEVFSMNSARYAAILEDLDEVVSHWFAREEAVGMDPQKCLNMNETKADIRSKLENLRDNPIMECLPAIYHLDVGAMYPNIILSNRLQPTVMVTEDDCRACEWADERDNCRKPMPWQCKGEHFPLQRGDVQRVKETLMNEKYSFRQVEELKSKLILNYRPKVEDEEVDIGDLDLAKDTGGARVKWDEIHPIVQNFLLKTRAKTVSLKTAGNKFKLPFEEPRQDHACQRGHDFYIQTVQDFRDRRVVYKTLKKTAEKKHELAESYTDKVEANDQILLYESLQLAHKCILNSFYGYVMRKGARWYSMGMAAVITHQGASIIDDAYKFCKDIGTPLELDTDGIWTLLPDIFPQRYDLEFKNEDDSITKRSLFFPCSLLNLDVYRQWTNKNYHTLSEDGTKYDMDENNSIFFELDGPYKCMLLPKSEKKGQKLKKRYVVFDLDETIVELKGFEIKRRGELQLIKNFQEQIFPAFLRGAPTRQGAYGSASEVAQTFLTLLNTCAAKCKDDSTLMPLICESKTIKKAADGSMGDQPKSMGITAAYRLTELLGDDTYITNGAVTLTYIVCAYPKAIEKTQRSIPIKVFEAAPAVRINFLRKWCGNEITEEQCNLRDVLDWDYYRTRLVTQVLKIVVLPGLDQGQRVLKDVALPEWAEPLARRIANGGRQSLNLNDFFKKSGQLGNVRKSVDIEDAAGSLNPSPAPSPPKALGPTEMKEQAKMGVLEGLQRSDRIATTNALGELWRLKRKTIVDRRAIQDRLYVQRPFRSYEDFKNQQGNATQWFYEAVKKGQLTHWKSLGILSTPQSDSEGIFKVLLGSGPVVIPILVKLLECTVIALPRKEVSENAMPQANPRSKPPSAPKGLKAGKSAFGGGGPASFLGMRQFMPTAQASQNLPAADSREIDCLFGSIPRTVHNIPTGMGILPALVDRENYEYLAVSLGSEHVGEFRRACEGEIGRGCGVQALYDYLPGSKKDRLIYIAANMNAAWAGRHAPPSEGAGGAYLSLDEFHKKPTYPAPEPIHAPNGPRPYGLHRLDVTIGWSAGSLMVSCLDFTPGRTSERMRTIQNEIGPQAVTLRQGQWRVFFSSDQQQLNNDARDLSVEAIMADSPEGKAFMQHLGRPKTAEGPWHSPFVAVEATKSALVQRVFSWLENQILRPKATDCVPLINLRVVNATREEIAERVPDIAPLLGLGAAPWAHAALLASTVESKDPMIEVKAHLATTKPFRQGDQAFSPHEKLVSGGFGADKAFLRYALVASIGVSRRTHQIAALHEAFHVPVTALADSLGGVPERGAALWNTLLGRRLHTLNVLIQPVHRGDRQKREVADLKALDLQIKSNQRDAELVCTPGMYRTMTVDLDLKDIVLSNALLHLSAVEPAFHNENHISGIPDTADDAAMWCVSEVVKAFYKTINLNDAASGLGLSSLLTVSLGAAFRDPEFILANSAPLTERLGRVRRKYLSKLAGALLALCQSRSIGGAMIHGDLNWKMILLSEERLVLKTPYHSINQGREAISNIFEELKRQKIFANFATPFARVYTHLCLYDNANFMAVSTKKFRGYVKNWDTLEADMALMNGRTLGLPSDDELLALKRDEMPLTYESTLELKTQCLLTGQWPIGRRLGPALNQLLSIFILETLLGPVSEARGGLRAKKETSLMASSTLCAAEEARAREMLFLEYPLQAYADDVFTETLDALKLTDGNLQDSVRAGSIPAYAPFIHAPPEGDASIRTLWKTLALLKDTEELHRQWHAYPYQPHDDAARQRFMVHKWLRQSRVLWSEDLARSVPALKRTMEEHRAEESLLPSITALMRLDRSALSDLSESFAFAPMPHPMRQWQDESSQMSNVDLSRGAAHILAARSIAPFLTRAVTLEPAWQRAAKDQQGHLLAAVGHLALIDPHSKDLAYMGLHPDDKFITLKPITCEGCLAPVSLPLLSMMRQRNEGPYSLERVQDASALVEVIQHIGDQLDLRSMEETDDSMASMFGWDCPKCLHAMDPGLVEDECIALLERSLTATFNIELECHLCDRPIDSFSKTTFCPRASCKNGEYGIKTHDETELTLEGLSLVSYFCPNMHALRAVLQGIIPMFFQS